MPLKVLCLLALTTPLLAAPQNQPFQESVKIVSDAPSSFRLGSEQGARITNTALSPIYLHYINSITQNRDFIELEDGSKWKIDTDDIEDTYPWRMGDTVILSPNFKWFSSYYYKIKNLTTHRETEIKVNPYKGPVEFGPYSHWIVSIDRQNRQLFLENGTSWEIAKCNSDIFDQWAINDTIILGVSNSWCSSYDSILINVNMNIFAYSKQY